MPYISTRCIIEETSEVIGIVEIDGRVIGDGKPGPVTKHLRDKFFRYAHGKEK